MTKVKNTFKILKFRYTSTSSSSDKGRSGGIPLLAKSGATSTTSGENSSLANFMFFMYTFDIKNLSVCIIVEFSFFIGDDRSIDHIGTQSLSCRLSGGDSSTSGQGSGTSGATTGQSFIIRFHIK